MNRAQPQWLPQRVRSPWSPQQCSRALMPTLFFARPTCASPGLIEIVRLLIFASIRRLLFPAHATQSVRTVGLRQALQRLTGRSRDRARLRVIATRRRFSGSANARCDLAHSNSGVRTSRQTRVEGWPLFSDVKHNIKAPAKLSSSDTIFPDTSRPTTAAHRA